MSSFTEVRIVTERLELREFGPQDATMVKALVAAGDRTSLPPGAPSRRSDVDAWLADGVHRHRLEGGGVHLMILERTPGELVGAISLFKTDWEARSSEVGYGVRPDRRGRGYASEAVAAVAQWALAAGGMQRIQLCAVTGNLPSLRVAEKAGFRREGTLRRAQLEDDGLHDLAVFSLLDDDPGVRQTLHPEGGDLGRLGTAEVTAGARGGPLPGEDAHEEGWRWVRWPSWSKMHRISAGPSWAPKACGIMVENSAAWPVSTRIVRSPSRSMTVPDRTVNQSRRDGPVARRGRTGAPAA